MNITEPVTLVRSDEEQVEYWIEKIRFGYKIMQRGPFNWILGLPPKPIEIARSFTKNGALRKLHNAVNTFVQSEVKPLTVFDLAIKTPDSPLRWSLFFFTGKDIHALAAKPQTQQ